MIDRRPGVIIQANSEQEVVRAVRFAAEHEILLALRSGGHSIAGKSSCNDGMLIDLRNINHVEVNVEQQTAKIGPGATLADIDAATQQHGLLVPTGINSTTGIAGLTLGGGFGWASGRFGLTIDNLIAVQLVSASGERVTASVDENPDLFWALRGGGGNFGVVTEFEFRLHQLDPEIYTGLIVFPLEQAQHVLATRSKLMANAPDDVSCWAVLRKAAPLPFIAEDWHGQSVIILAACFLGPVEAGKAAIQKLAGIGSPIGQMLSPMSFTDWQAIFDPFAEPGMRNYWKSQDLAELEENAAELLVHAAFSSSSAKSWLFQ
ncbi:MAG: FAD-binding oxidoreductase [Pseudomonadota bacterium]